MVAKSFHLLAGFLLKFCLFGLLLGSCSKQAPLRLTLDWVLNPHHAPLVLALTQGFFKEEGLEIELIPAQGSLEGCIQVAAGAADLALTTEAQWIIQKDKGLDLKPVLTLISQPLEVLVSRVPLNQLKDKRVGHASSGVGFSAAVLKQALENQGLTLEDVIPVHTKYGLVTALLTKQVDAIINGYKTYLMVDLKYHEETFYTYSYEYLGVPLFAAQVVVANKHVPLPVKEALQRALEKACQFLKQNPDKAWIIFKTYKPELDTPANQELWPFIVGVFNVDPLPVSQDRYVKLKEFLKKNGLLENS